MGRFTDDLTDTQRVERAHAALKIQNAVTALALRHDPLLVMEVVRSWLDYMDQQIARIDGET